MKTVVSLLAVAGLAAAASAQTYEAGGANVIFEVWNGSSWTNNANVLPGQTVEWRARVQYTGARTDLNGMAEMWWQPTFQNADNAGAGAAADQVSVGQGVPSGNSSGGMVAEADGGSGVSLGAYGRVLPFGLAATNAASSNVTSVFRHSGGGAVPAGEWIRVAGSGSSNWAPSLADTALSTTTANTQLLLRGIQSNQTSEASSAAIHSESMSPVVFRGSFTASDDTALRTVVLNTDERFLRRVGGNTSNDNRRYIAWQTSQGDTGTGTTGHRTFANGFFGANINIVPTPASIALMGLGGLVAARRRRA